MENILWLCLIGVALTAFGHVGSSFIGYVQRRNVLNYVVELKRVVFAAQAVVAAATEVYQTRADGSLHHHYLNRHTACVDN